jgi:hypothetical protein
MEDAMKKIWFEVRRWTTYKGKMHDLEPIYRCSNQKRARTLIKSEYKRDPLEKWRIVKITEEELMVLPKRAKSHVFVSQITYQDLMKMKLPRWKPTIILDPRWLEEDDDD